MKKLIVAAACAAGLVSPAAAVQQTQAETPRAAQTLPNVLIVYEMPNYNGRSYEVRELRRNGVVTPNGNWLVRSFSIHPGDRWEICGESRFRNCVTIDRSVHDASLIGLQGRIGSTRQVTGEPAAQAPAQ